MHRFIQLGAVALAFAAISGCGGSSGTSPASSSTGDSSAASTGTVNMVIQDSPATNLTVLSFQIDITGAALQPGNVSLLPKPVTVDLAQLVTDTGFLASTVVDSATYTSMTMTVANPRVTIINNTGAAIVTPSQTCAAGATCTFTPRLNTASLTISSGVFPITVTASSSTGLALDLSIPDLLQSDLSITLANGSSVNLSLLPQPKANGAQAQLDDVLGVIQSVGAGQLQIKTAFGALLVLTTDSSTAYNFPQSICAQSAASCLAANQVVTANLSLLPNGGLKANTVTFAASPGTTVAQGIVVSVGSAPSAEFQMLVRKVLPNSASFTPGEVVDVTPQAGALFSVASNTHPVIAGASFAESADVLPGQEVLVDVTQPTVAADDGNPAFTSGSVVLESSQIAGRVSLVDTGTMSFGLTNVWSLFNGLSPAIAQLQIQTGGTTSFVGYTTADFSSVSVGSVVRAKGPLFRAADSSSSVPTIAALQVSGRQ
jgi:hypothetical protein